MVNVTNGAITPATFCQQFNTIVQGLPLVPIGMGAGGIVFGSDEGAVVGRTIEPLVGIGSKRDLLDRVKDAMPGGELKKDSRILNAATQLDKVLNEDIDVIFGDGFENCLKIGSGPWATWQHLKRDGLFHARAIMGNYMDEFHMRGDFILLSELAQAMLDTLPLSPGVADPAKAAFVSGVLSNFSGVEGSAARAAQAFLFGAEYMSGSGDLVGSAMVEDIAAHVADKGDLDGSMLSMQRRAASRWAGALEELRGRGHEADFEAALYRGLLRGWKGHGYEELERLYKKSADSKGNAEIPEYRRAGEDRLRAAQIRVRFGNILYISTAEDWATMSRYLDAAVNDLKKAETMGNSAGIDLNTLQTLSKAARSFSPRPGAMRTDTGFTDPT